MVVELLIEIADRGGHGRSYTRTTGGGDDFGGSHLAGPVGRGAVGDGADGEPVGAWSVHPDKAAGGGRQAGVHPVASGAVFGDCEVLPGGWERVSGGDAEGCGELSDSKGADSKRADPGVANARGSAACRARPENRCEKLR